MLSSVVFPAPFGPTTAATRPGGKLERAVAKRPKVAEPAPQRARAGRPSVTRSPPRPARASRPRNRSPIPSSSRPARRAAAIQLAKRRRRVEYAAGVSLREALHDVGALTRPARRQTLPFELLVRLQHGVRVHRRARRHLVHRRQLVPRLEPAEPQGLLHLLHELQIRRSTAPLDMEIDHPCKLLYLWRSGSSCVRLRGGVRSGR